MINFQKIANNYKMKMMFKEEIFLNKFIKRILKILTNNNY